jgi:hypothetical protein
MATLTAGEKARMYALGKIMRGGASRGGYVSSQVFIAIDGVHVGFGATPHRVLLDTLTITDELDETPNTCGFRLNGLVPAAGAEVVLTLGSKNAATRLYAGFALTVQQLYVGDKPANVQADVRCVDYTWQFGFLTVTKQYRNLSATAVAQLLILTYAAANGFTSGAVDPNLPVLDEITFTNEPLDAVLTRIARRIGGYWFVDYQKVVHLFLEDDPAQAPVPLTPTHKSLRAFQTSADRTQVLTRVYVEGRGSNALAPVAPGETMIPLAAVDMFAVGPDVFVKVSPQGSTGGAQHLTYTGVTEGGAGALVGSGTAPSSAPVGALTSGGAVTVGDHYYLYTWRSASGESLASPPALVTISGTAPVGIGPDLSIDPGAGLVTPGTYRYGSTQITAAGESVVAGDVPAVCTTTTPTPLLPPSVRRNPGYSTNVAGARDNVLFRVSYRSTTGVSPAVYGPSAPYTLPDILSNESMIVTIPPVTTTAGAVYCDLHIQNTSTDNIWRQLRVGMPVPVAPAGGMDLVMGTETTKPNPAVDTGGFPVARVTVVVKAGGAGVTARRVYRTKQNGTQKYFLREVAGSAQTSFLDTAADSTLVTLAPTGGVLAQTVTVTGIATGPKGAGGGPVTTARTLYRTTAGLAAWGTVATIADNTTTTFVDTLADASLGPLGPPVTDTAGLLADGGQVLAGAPTIPVSGTGAFPAAGGWVLAGNNRIHYTGVASAALTGIPTSGDGSIGTTIPYGQPATLAPLLTGIPTSGAGAITAPIVAGDELYLVVQRDDPARQGTVATMVKSGPGVREEWVQDRRLSIAEARNRADATLATRPLEDVTVTYQCRDRRTAAGKTVTVNLPAPTNVFGTFKIQSVTINNFRPYPTQYPTYTVTASSRRFNFEDWLRRMETSV